MSNITITGERLSTATQSSENFEFEIETFKLTSTRSAAHTSEKKIDDEDIIELTFDDGSEWIVAAEDYPELSPNKSRAAVGSISFPLEFVASNGTDRSFVKKAIVVAVSYIKGKAKEKATGLAIDVLSKNIAMAADKRMMATPGFCKVNRDFSLDFSTGISESQPKCLVMIHGTASSTAGSFSGLATNTKEWDQILDHYSGNIYALEHYTLSVSPVQNAIDILKQLPQNAVVDIITHSRGGLVGDVLARCDRRNGAQAFSNDEIAAIKEADGTSLHQLMQQVNTLADEKTITVEKMIRVACPAAGTTLLSNRLDHYLNAMLTAIGAAFGITAPLYKIVKTLLLEVVKMKGKPHAFPGLVAMIPDSPYQQINNGLETKLQGQLFVIAGDAEFGGSFGHSLAVMLTNLFYRRANDFVVDTKSMHRGVLRENGFYFKLAKGKNVSHFNYFKNEQTTQLIHAAFTSPTLANSLFELKTIEEQQRGLITKLFNLDPYNLDTVRGKRPIVILLPGIMGSTLAPKNGETVWLNPKRMNRGAVVNELGPNHEVEANGVIGRFYKDLAVELNGVYDVRVFPFDWRLSVALAAKQLKKIIEDYQAFNQPINLVAHSMGGVVLRQLMMDEPEFYRNHIAKPTSKTVFLGTPWLGSYLIMEVFTGQSSRVKQVNFIDFKNGKRQLLRTFTQYHGLYDLLPIDDQNLESLDFWTDIKTRLQDDQVSVPPQQMLDYFAANKKKVKSFTFDFTNTYYVAGTDDKTTNGFHFDASKRRSSPIQFTHTPYGDSSVTWDSGIPKGLDPARVYYTHISHMNLSNHKFIFSGLQELLAKGSTMRFSKTRPTNRGAQLANDEQEFFLPASTEEELLNNIFGTSSKDEFVTKQTSPLEISVTHGTLAFAQYPLLAGHFKDDGILSAEENLDACLGGKLKERHRINQYPNEIGEQLILFNLNSQPVGGIVVGLGDVFSFNVYNLTKTIERAVVQYALFIRDNYTTERALAYSGKLSSLFIGSGYGGLNLRDSIRAIVEGVAKANKSIVEMSEGLSPITQLEFVDYYEDLAQSGYQILAESLNDYENITLKNGILKTRGGKKRVNNTQGKNWWHSFSTSIDQPDDFANAKLEFISSSGIARVEKDAVTTELKVLELIVKSLSQNKTWEPKAAKTLFELIVPNAFKDVMRNHNNIQWKMDEYAAQFPWELFHDSNSGKEPTFTRAGLIRQLISDKSFAKPNFVNKDTALVIADPIYNDINLPQLPFAKIEGERISELYAAHQLNVTTKINAGATDILTEIFAHEYKIMHFCGHGLYDPKNNTVGLAIGDGLLITPGTFKQLSYVPEIVFINCCHAGNINFNDERYTQSRNKLAANIGTQLIHLGAKVVIVAAWAIDDAAALKFAEVVYDGLFNGLYYGDAVLKARNVCFEQFPNNNTWGAYQCYGDHFFKLRTRQSTVPKARNYVLQNQVLVDLDNLCSDVIGAKMITPNFKKELEAISAAAENSNFRNGAAIELEARIFGEMGEFEEALMRYNTLPKLNEATFSFRAIEQALTLESKILLNKQKSGVSVAKDLTAFLKKTDVISNLGPSAKRKAVMASIYRRAAQCTTGATRAKHFNQALDCYAEAVALSGKLEPDPYIFKNMLIIAALVFPKKKEREDYLIVQQLSHWEEWLAQQIENPELRTQWVDFSGFSKFKTHIVAHVLQSKLASNTAFKDASIAEYKQHLAQGARHKEIVTEVEYVEMLLLMKKELGIHQSLVTELENLLGQLKQSL